MAKKWRKQLKKMMYEATLEEAQRRFDTRKPSFNYRWEHVLAVHTLAMKLAALTGADAEVVEAAVWLHDVAKEAGDKHPEKGAAFARRYLPKTNFPEDKIERVAQAIADHMGLWRNKPLTNVESQVLWDADKLAKLGLTAAFHWMGMQFAAADETLTTEKLMEKMQDNNWQKKTVASMHTEPARRAAASRLESFHELWRELETELRGDDLM